MIVVHEPKTICRLVEHMPSFHFCSTRLLTFYKMHKQRLLMRFHRDMLFLFVLRPIKSTPIIFASIYVGYSRIIVKRIRMLE
jgi:hypothetical protein